MGLPILGLGEKGVYFANDEKGSAGKSPKNYVDLLRSQPKLNPTSNSFYNDVMAELVKSGKETGHPKLPEGSRESVLALLEIVLIDSNGLSEHLRWLQEQFGREPVCMPFTDELLDKFDKVAGSGPQELGNKNIFSDGELASLVIDPVSLMGFRDYLYADAKQELTDAWFDAIKRDAYQRRGIKIHTAEEAFNKVFNTKQ